MEGMTAMHFAPLITLSGIALSGVPITSSSTLAEASIRLAMSDCSLSSADQLTPTRSEQRPSTTRHLEAGEASSLIFVLFRARREHLLFECHVNVSRHPTAFYPLEAVQNRRSFRTSEPRKPCMERVEGATVFTLLWVFRGQNKLQSLLDTTPPKRVPVLWDGPAPAPSKRGLYRTTNLQIPLSMDGVLRLGALFWPGKFPKEAKHALLGIGVPGHRAHCRSFGLYGSSGRFCRDCEGTLHHLPRALSGLSRDALG